MLQSLLGSLLNPCSAPGLLAYDTLAFAAAMKPFVQTRRMKTVVARAALKIGEFVCLDGDDRIAHGTRFEASKFLVHVLLPQHECVEESPILIVQHYSNVQSPSFRFLFRNFQVRVPSTSTLCRGNVGGT